MYKIFSIFSVFSVFAVFLILPFGPAFAGKDSLFQTHADELKSKATSTVSQDGGDLYQKSRSIGNWDIEQASARINEAEREIKRLGFQIEEDRAQCAREKREIEYMLFDPEIATQEQISKLNELEEMLEAAKNDIESQKDFYERKIAALENALSGINTASGAPSSGAGVTSIGYNNNFIEDRARSAVTYKPYNPYDVDLASIRPRVLDAMSSTSLSGDGFVSMHDLRNVLGKAGIRVEALAQEDSISSSVEEDGFVSYSWDTGVIFGSTEQYRISSPEQFSSMVNDYLSRTERRCDGDFGALPSTNAFQQEVGMNIQVSAYEIACVTKDMQSASVSVIFFNKNGIFTVIAHESGLESMDVAIDSRDRLFSAFIR
jgi:hypothetical protein